LSAFTSPVHAACTMASDASSSPKHFHSRSPVALDPTCGSIFEGIMQCSVPFVQQSLCLQRRDNGSSITVVL